MIMLIPFSLPLESESLITELPSSSSYPPVIDDHDLLLGLISCHNLKLTQQGVENWKTTHLQFSPAFGIQQ